MTSRNVYSNSFLDNHRIPDCLYPADTDEYTFRPQINSELGEHLNSLFNLKDDKFMQKIKKMGFDEDS